MDSVTQIALGAAVGELTLNDETSNRGAFWGGVVGVIPDLDVLAGPLLTDVGALTFHRGISHSLLGIAVMTPLIALALYRFRGGKPPPRSWMAMTGLVLATHVFLDCLTTYGTQIFQPFSALPVSISSVFVIDPLYTLTLATGLAAGLLRPSGSRRRKGLVAAGLFLSTLYLGTGLAGKARASAVFQENLRSRDVAYERLKTFPTPFNGVLWWTLAETEDGYRVGLYSLLDPDQEVDFVRVPRNDSLLAPYREEREVRQLLRFSQGYYHVERREGRLYFADLRFGRTDAWLTEEAPYVFTWELIPDPSDPKQLRAIDHQPERAASGELLGRFGRRILGRTAPLDRP